MITLQNLSKNYGKVRALKSVTLELSIKETLAIVGPSGCGKTTLLRLVAGLETPDAGCIQIDGVDASTPTRIIAPHKRELALIFQDLALWPHMTVKEHLAFVLNSNGLAREVAESRIFEILAAVGLNNYAERYSNQLSGGEQQRLAIARALASRPKYLLMDEPFSNLDVIVKEELFKFIMGLKRSLYIGIIFVTHHIEEAFFLADSIAIMNSGTIVQTGCKDELLEKSKNDFVCRFLQAGRKIYESG